MDLTTLQPLRQILGKDEFFPSWADESVAVQLRTSLQDHQPRLSCVSLRQAFKLSEPFTNEPSRGILAGGGYNCYNRNVVIGQSWSRWADLTPRY